ncbi:subtilase family protein [Jatrophihabitans sp. GAS493]|uniref:S8 family serine peptidase n=1 Tax=Jatrophihabitans sp. GAS493 TaxID=1907575 RepID=UPI000BC0D19D|nr:S8 family serine peptidase [Jatrophihabitans sp. GAS493]SOD72401.1 subtilase family protein [Jatrophihabitans sp. GAS493]
MSHRRLLRTSLAIGLSAAILAATPGTASADAIRDGQWWLSKLAITPAWALTKGDGVKVAVYDTGVDGTHPDLHGAIAGGTDTTGKGTPDGLTPVAGIAEGSTDPTNPASKAQHGTAMAVFIGGRGHGPDNASGLIGSAPASKLLALSTFGGNDSAAQATQAIHWAVDNGAKVINMSFGGGGPSAADIGYAQAHDVVLVAGSGNDGAEGAMSGPASHFGVVVVGGVDADLRRDATADYGGPSTLAGDLETPGLAVVGPDSTSHVAGEDGDLPSATTVAQGTYTTTLGTSNASAIVSGIVALIRAKFPTMDAANVINRLIRTATPASGGGYSNEIGFGVPNAYKALTADVPSVCENPLGSEATQSTGVWQSIVDGTTYKPACTPTNAPTAPTTAGATSTGTSASPAKSSSSNALLIGIGTLGALAVLVTIIVVMRRGGGPGGPPDGPSGPGSGGSGPRGYPQPPPYPPQYNPPPQSPPPPNPPQPPLGYPPAR